MSQTILQGNCLISLFCLLFILHLCDRYEPPNSITLLVSQEIKISFSSVQTLQPTGSSFPEAPNCGKHKLTTSMLESLFGYMLCLYCPLPYRGQPSHISNQCPSHLEAAGSHAGIILCSPIMVLSCPTIILCSVNLSHFYLACHHLVSWEYGSLFSFYLYYPYILFLHLCPLFTPYSFTHHLKFDFEFAFLIKQAGDTPPIFGPWMVRGLSLYLSVWEMPASVWVGDCRLERWVLRAHASAPNASFTKQPYEDTPSILWWFSSITDFVYTTSALKARVSTRFERLLQVSIWKS